MYEDQEFYEDLEAICETVITVYLGGLAVITATALFLSILTGSIVAIAITALSATILVSSCHKLLKDDDDDCQPV